MTAPNGKDASLEVGTLIAKILRGAWRPTPPPPDFTAHDLERALPFLLQTYTTGLAWWRIRRSPLETSPLGPTLREHYIAHSVRAAQTTHRVYQYVSALQNAGIDPILFKGWALLPHYAEPGLRPMGDIDLAVIPEQASRAVEILTALGATALQVDVHPGLGDPAHAAYIPNASWAQVQARSQVTPLGNLSIRRLGPEDNLQLLCIHCMRHLAGRPYWLSDVAAVLETRPPEFDWSRALSKPPYTSWVVYAILLAHRLLGVDIENTPLAARTDELPAWIVDDVLARWSQLPGDERMVYESVLRLWRSPSRWQQAVRVRIPNRFAAAIDFHGALDAPFLARYQVLAVFQRITKFATRNTAPKHF